MGIFNEQSFDHPFAKGIPGAPGVGFSLTANGDYDMNKKKLTNVAAPTDNNDSATKKYVDYKSKDPHSSTQLNVDSNIDMKDQYIVFLTSNIRMTQMSQPQNNTQTANFLTEMVPEQ